MCSEMINIVGTTCLLVLLVAGPGYSHALWSRVELSTCEVPMVDNYLSLCCHTNNIPEGASIFFYMKPEGQSLQAFYRIKPRCLPQNILYKGFSVINYNCEANRNGGGTIYRIRISKTYLQMIGIEWNCGFYGNSSSLVLNENQVLTSYHGNMLFHYTDQVVLSWTVTGASNSSVLEIYRPAGDVIVSIVGQNISFVMEGFSVTGDVSSSQVNLSVTTVSPEINGTYVCSYSNTATVRDGITVVLLAQPKMPHLIASKLVPPSNNVVSGRMFCNSSSQSAAPLYYKPSLQYIWTVPNDLDDPNFTNVTMGNGSIYIPQIQCSNVTSLPVYCQATEGDLNSYFSSPMNLSAFCTARNSEVSPPKEYDSKITVVTTLLFITGFLFVTVVSVTVVVTRKKLKKKGRRCCRILCGCSRCCRRFISSDSDSDSDLGDILQESRREQQDRLRQQRRRFEDLLNDGIEGNNSVSLADGLARQAEERAVQEAIERLVIEDSLQNQQNRERSASQETELSFISGNDGAYSQEVEMEIPEGAVGGLPEPSRPVHTGQDDLKVDDLNAVERLLDQHNQHLSRNVVHLDIDRSNIVQNVLHLYTDSALGESRVVVKMKDEHGMDCGGVTEDMYTTFWYKAQEQYFTGYEAVVPYLPMNRWNDEEIYYRILGRILSHSMAVTKSLPLPLCKSAIIVMVFETTNVDKQTILEDFLFFLDPVDRSLVTTGINNFGSLTREQIDEIQSIFIRFDYPAVIQERSFNDHLTQLARNTVCIRPKPLLDLMREGIPQPHLQHFWSMFNITYLGVLFRALRPNPQRVIDRLKPDPAEEHLTQRQRRALRYLRDFIKELSHPELETFLHFLTGKKSMPRQAIVVCFTDETGLQRAPKAHTCSNLLELPETYEDYKSFKSEFKHLLAADEALTMTLA